MHPEQISIRLALTLVLTGALVAHELAADNFRKLSDAQIRARLAGMEITDGVHWAEQYMRDGTYKAYHLGKPSKGKWYAKDGELCLEDGKAESECREVWISGNKIEFRGTGLEGVLQSQQKRG